MHNRELIGAGGGAGGDGSSLPVGLEAVGPEEKRHKRDVRAVHGLERDAIAMANEGPGGGGGEEEKGG